MYIQLRIVSVMRILAFVGFSSAALRLAAHAIYGEVITPQACLENLYGSTSPNLTWSFLYHKIWTKSRYSLGKLI